MGDRSPSELIKNAKGNINRKDLTSDSGIFSTYLYDGPLINHIKKDEQPEFIFSSNNKGYKITDSDGSERTPHHTGSEGKRYMLVTDQRILYVAGCDGEDKLIEHTYNNIDHIERIYSNQIEFNTTSGLSYKFTATDAKQNSIKGAVEYVSGQIHGKDLITPDKQVSEDESAAEPQSGSSDNEVDYKREQKDGNLSTAELAASIYSHLDDDSEKRSGIPLDDIIPIVGIFALVGFGIGSTGGVAISQLGGGIASGILTLVVLTVSFLLGPVVGIVAGIRSGGQHGRTSRALLASFIGSIAGYIVMMIIMFISLGFVSSVLMGSGGTTAAQSTTTSSGGGLSIGGYIVPIIAVALPTGITGLGGVFFGAGSQ